LTLLFYVDSKVLSERVKFYVDSKTVKFYTVHLKKNSWAINSQNTCFKCINWDDSVYTNNTPICTIVTLQKTCLQVNACKIEKLTLVCSDCTQYFDEPKIALIEINKLV